MAHEVIVESDIEKVELALKEALSADEMNHISLSAAKQPDPFAPAPNQDLPTLGVVVVSIGTSLAANLIYDLVKKVTHVLIARFPGKVKSDDDGSTK
ncbi:MAG: hypothetical protein WA265_12355 [Rhodomicrobium sp.]